MEKYQKIKQLGQGSFGNVQKAQNTVTKEIVAIKQLKKKYGTWEECLQLSEVKALRKMDHQNIIKLKEVIRVMNQAYFVFEYIEKDLYKLITQRKEKGSKLKDAQIRKLTKQMVQALQYIHKKGFFHRDLKPQNVLISENLTVKIIDFGIAKQIRSQPPFTEYISTRWYRAPQILLKFSTYSIPVDIFALGCLVAQMYLMKPLFMGNSEQDQISKICSVIGSPTLQNWPQGIKQANVRGFNFPEYKQIQLSSVIPDCPADGLDFIQQCLRWDPSKRMTTTQMLNHPFLQKQLEIIEVNPMQQNKYLTNQTKNTTEVSKKIYNQYDKDDQFQQLLNNFSKKLSSESPQKKKGMQTKINSGSANQQDEWF